MFNRACRAAALAAVFTAPLSGQALAYDGRGARSEILAELPADAPPGDCYARVVVPGEPIQPPPVQKGARWVLSPGPAGSPGPIWCLVPTGPMVSPPPIAGPSRSGWIRVLCDADATPARIGQVQRRLHERGDYRGEMSGRYDRDTAEALTRFQEREGIRHGGYLSLDTLDALEAARGHGHQAQSRYDGRSYSYSSRSYSTSSSYQSSGAWGNAYHPAPPYASTSPVLRNGWLVWNGKTEF